MTKYSAGTRFMLLTIQATERYRAAPPYVLPLAFGIALLLLGPVFSEDIRRLDILFVEALGPIYCPLPCSTDLGCSWR